MSGCSIPLVIMEMQIKITMRCYYTPTRRAKIKQNDNISISADVQQAGPSNTGVNAENVTTLGNAWQFLLHQNIPCPQNSQVYSQVFTVKYKDPCGVLFRVALTTALDRIRSSVYQKRVSHI